MSPSPSRPGPQDEIDYTFADRDDAVRYLRDLVRLWAAWVIALAGLASRNPIVLIVWGAVVLTVLIFMMRPMQRRAAELVPEDRAVAATRGLARGTSLRDRAVHELAYGTEPLRAALRAVGMSERWLVMRQVMFALTLLAFIYSIVTALP